MLKFYRYFPILRAPGELAWTHYCEVLGLPSTAERDFYLSEAARHNWTIRELKAHIQANAFAAQNAALPETDPGPPLEPRRGRLYTYRYDRYLADIFYLSGEMDPETVGRRGVFLNREPAEAGLAKRVEA